MCVKKCSVWAMLRSHLKHYLYFFSRVAQSVSSTRPLAAEFKVSRPEICTNVFAEICTLSLYRYAENQVTMRRNNQYAIWVACLPCCPSSCPLWFPCRDLFVVATSRPCVCVSFVVLLYCYDFLLFMLEVSSL